MSVDWDTWGKYHGSEFIASALSVIEDRGEATREELQRWAGWEIDMLWDEWAGRAIDRLQDMFEARPDYYRTPDRAVVELQEDLEGLLTDKTIDIRHGNKKAIIIHSKCKALQKNENLTEKDRAFLKEIERRLLTDYFKIEEETDA